MTDQRPSNDEQVIGGVENPSGRDDAYDHMDVAGPGEAEGSSEAEVPSEVAEAVPGTDDPAEARQVELEPEVILGIRVPYAAPPTETNQTHSVLKLVLPLVFGVVLCLGIGVAFVTAMVQLTAALERRVETAAVDFMSDVSDGQWSEAHDRLCSELRSRPVEVFVPEWANWEGMTWTTVRTYERAGEYRVVVSNEAAERIDLRIVFENEEELLDVTICGWESD